MTFYCLPPASSNLSAAIRGPPHQNSIQQALFELDPSPLLPARSAANGFERAWRAPGDLQLPAPSPVGRRDGTLRTDSSALGQHTVFVRGHRNFLSYSRSGQRTSANTDCRLWLPWLKQEITGCVSLLAGMEAIKMASLTRCACSTETVGPADHSLELLRQTAVTGVRAKALGGWPGLLTQGISARFQAGIARLARSLHLRTSNSLAAARFRAKAAFERYRPDRRPRAAFRGAGMEQTTPGRGSRCCHSSARQNGRNGFWPLGLPR